MGVAASDVNVNCPEGECRLNKGAQHSPSVSDYLKRNPDKCNDADGWAYFLLCPKGPAGPAGPAGSSLKGKDLTLRAECKDGILSYNCLPEGLPKPQTMHPILADYRNPDEKKEELKKTRNPIRKKLTN